MNKLELVISWWLENRGKCGLIYVPFQVAYCVHLPMLLCGLFSFLGQDTLYGTPKGTVLGGRVLLFRKMAGSCTDPDARRGVQKALTSLRLLVHPLLVAPTGCKYLKGYWR